MVTKNSKHVQLAGFSYKQAPNGIFGITLPKKSLPMQLFHGGKTVQSFPKFKFLESLSLSVNLNTFEYNGIVKVARRNQNFLSLKLKQTIEFRTIPASITDSGCLQWPNENTHYGKAI